MRKVSQIINARWVVPIVPRNKVFENYSIVIEDDFIIDLLPEKDAKKQYYSDINKSFDQSLVMPGMINAHTHLAMNYLRGIADDLSLETWLSKHIWPVEGAIVSPEMVLQGTTHAIAESIRSGVTCVNDHYFFPESVIKAIDKTGIRARVANCIFNFPVSWVKDVNQYFEDTRYILDSSRSHSRIYAAVGPHAPYTVDDDVMNKVYNLTKQYKIPMHIHMHESKAEIKNYKNLNGISAIEHFYNNGWLDKYTIAVHMTQISSSELDIVASARASVVHCPESNMKLSSGAFPWQNFKEKNINIALGTDSAASNNDLDMFGEMKSASFLAKLQFGAEALKAHEVLEMATINGAKALHLDHLVGSLEKGKKADFIVVDLDQPETQPIYNPIAQIVYSASRSQVSDVWCDGKRLLNNYKLETIDLTEVKYNQQKWSDKVLQLK